ncbi:HalOD1 output domain-containing protein [Natrarchaeobius sp. A-rgal3]|uniref:HalOD1 output domain-containing protein n=1 Tax=Natrarchaeobius versutus TaxID=1679078 RepID=UPI00350F3D88
MRRVLQLESVGVCERIVTEVAKLDDVDPVVLPPLYETIDPDALSSVFAQTRRGTVRSGRVEFRYAGYDVTVEFGAETVVTIE